MKPRALSPARTRSPAVGHRAVHRAVGAVVERHERAAGLAELLDAQPDPVDGRQFRLGQFWVLRV